MVTRHVNSSCHGNPVKKLMNVIVTLWAHTRSHHRRRQTTTTRADGGWPRSRQLAVMEVGDGRRGEENEEALSAKEGGGGTLDIFHRDAVLQRPAAYGGTLAPRRFDPREGRGREWI